MIDKLIIDGSQITLTEKDTLPYTYMFTQLGTHTVKYGLTDTDEVSASAFANCTNMTSVKFPKEITKIKRKAFQNCSKLNNVVIPATIKYIGANVWDGCTSLDNMTFEATTPPENYSEVPAKCKVYIPDDSKYLMATSYNDLDPDTTDYYTRSAYNQYSYVPARNIKDDGTYYYYDAWTSVAPNAQTIEQKNRIPISRLQFAQQSVNMSRYDKEKNPVATTIVLYSILPADATNRKIYVYSDKDYSDLTPKQLEDREYVAMVFDDTVEGELIIAAGTKTGVVTLSIYSESGAYDKLTVRVS